MSITQHAIQIRVRPFHKDDEKIVQDLFVESMHNGDEAPFTAAMRELWTQPVSLVIYTTTLLGLSAYTTSQTPTMRHSALGLSIISVVLLFVYRHMIASMFTAFSKEALTGDMCDIEEYYDIKELRKWYNLRSSRSAANSKWDGSELRVDEEEKEKDAEVKVASASSPKSAFWVAEAFGGDSVEGYIVGMAALDMRTTPDPVVGELRRVVVSPRARRRGVAKKLLSALVEHAKAQGVKSIFLTTSQYQEAAIQMYKRLGWKDAFTLRKRFMLNVVLIRGLSLDVEDYRD